MRGEPLQDIPSGRLEVVHRHVTVVGIAADGGHRHRAVTTKPIQIVEGQTVAEEPLEPVQPDHHALGSVALDQELVQCRAVAGFQEPMPGEQVLGDLQPKA
jgi:hypothetical protein